MADPLGFISGSARGAQSLGAANGGLGAASRSHNAGEASGFKDVLLKSLNEVNKAQQEATRAVEDLQTGQRNDLEGVILATQKADNAFRMLQALRNRMVEAYDEVKQIRV